VTWSIPDHFGGMTGAMLHRSRAFVRLGGVTVDILTFDARADYPEVEQRLRASGQLIDGMRLLNLWDWLREQPVQGTAADAPGFAPLAADPAYLSAYRGETELIRTRHAEDGVTELQVDHYRSDGTLAISDRRDTRERGTAGGRSIVLVDRDGRPAASWKGAWALYRWWLDEIRDGERATLIVDSKTAARFVLGYRRPDVVTMHVVHASHLEGPASAPRLRESRREVLENAGRYDGIVFLTERQRADATRMLGGGDNFCVIPNGRDVRPQQDTTDRSPGRGIVLASLDRRKRVDHAVRAVAAARAAGTPVTLDVYGDGPDRPQVEQAAAASGGAVTVHGYDPQASERLGAASFLLLSSRSEGLPLVLVESMAAGCIPIAYDVDYGPADIIDDGVNGFLVPPGDIDGLAAAIGRLQRMPVAQITAMRRAAMRTAADFGDEAVTRRWADELARAWRRHGFPPSERASGLGARLRRGIARRLRELRVSPPAR